MALGRDDAGAPAQAQDVVQIGTLAATILFRRIDGDTSPVQTHIVPVSLIPRGSGEISALAG